MCATVPLPPPSDEQTNLANRPNKEPVPMLGEDVLAPITVAAQAPSTPRLPTPEAPAPPPQPQLGARVNYNMDVQPKSVVNLPLVLDIQERQREPQERVGLSRQQSPFIDFTYLNYFGAEIAKNRQKTKVEEKTTKSHETLKY